jgi:hypothetical protein
VCTDGGSKESGLGSDANRALIMRNALVSQTILLPEFVLVTPRSQVSCFSQVSDPSFLIL